MAASMIASPPPSGGLAPHLLSTKNNSNSIDQKQPPWKSQAVNRTNELLSCARTALKIGQHNHRQRQEQQLKEQQQGQQGSLLFQSRSNKDDNTFPEWLVDINPAQLSLYQPPPPSSDHHHHHDQKASSSDSTTSLLSDSQSLLSLLDNNLSQLHSLVRKRGHTNDPTQQINSLMSKFQEAAQEMKQVCELLRLAGTTTPIDPYDNTTTSNKRKRSSGQRRKHYELVSTQLELLAKERMERLKVELETRSQVLRDQTNRRKLLATGAGAGGTAATSVTANGKSVAPPPPPRTSTTATRLSQPSRLPKSNPKSAPSQFQSPLFTATSGAASSNSGGVQRRSNAHHSNNNSSSSGYSGYAGYGGTTNTSTSSSAGYGGTSSRAGYGGLSKPSSSASSAPSFATGIRQRKQQQQQQSRIQIDHGGDNDDDKYNKDSDSSTTATVQQQIQERRQNRAAQSRLASARLAEKSIAELGVMFTKMSTLISQQGEVLERIEDDVEAAGLDIDAGHDELVKVYGMTKGNRGLILKVFGILIFLIVFMKLY
eukprot:scaffold355_cov127-Skeletonema_dohrnii-CCMP3373.AAC.16